MAVDVRETLSEMQGTLIEPEDQGQSWPSGLWTAAEVYAALNQRQSEFLRRTQVTQALATVTPTPSNTLVDLPPDWIATQEVIYDDGTAAQELPRADTWQGDRALPTWQQTADVPVVYSDADGPQTLQLTLQPASAAACTLDLVYVSLGELIEGDLGELFSVPDEAVLTVVWGALGDLLKKIGRAEDLARAAYCESRFEEGVLIWSLVLDGVM